MNEIKKFIHDCDLLNEVFNSEIATSGGEFYRGCRPKYPNRFVGFVCGILVEAFTSAEEESNKLYFHTLDKMNKDKFENSFAQIICERMTRKCKENGVMFKNFEVVNSMENFIEFKF